jgi:WD40 repeat protein
MRWPPESHARALAMALLAGLLAAACQRAAPPIPSTRVATIRDVNTPGAFMDAVALAPDGSRVATGERSGAIRVWTVDSAPQSIRVGAYRQAVADLAFSPDGALLATIGRSRESTLRLWQDDGTGEWKERAAIPIGRCIALRFDAAGALLAVACEADVMLLEVPTRRVAASLSNPHPEPLTAFDLAADGRRAITAGHEGGVTVWEVGTAAAVRTFSVRRSRRKHGPPKGMEADTAWAVAVALTADGKQAAAATIEGSIFVWDLDTGAELLADVDNDATGPPHSALRFTADGRLLAPTGDRAGMRLIDVSRRRSQVVSSGAKAFHAVSVAADATRYAALTSTLGDRQLSYAVDVWRFTLPPVSP